MAVPKKKTSKSRRDMRRSHHAIKKQNIVFDSKTGEPKLAHHMSPESKTYGGRQVIAIKAREGEEE